MRGTGVLARMVAPYGRHPILELAERGLLGPETVVAHAVHVGRRGDRRPGRDGRRRRPLPALERRARLRRRAARAPARAPASASASAPTARHRRSRSTCSTSCAPRCCSHAPAPADPEALSTAARCSSRRWTARARSGSTTAARSLRACSPTSSPCGSTARRSGPATTRSRRSCWAARRRSSRWSRSAATSLYGVDSTAFERALAAAADARSRLLEPRRHLPHMIIWIRNRKGWVAASSSASPSIFAAVVHHRRRRHGQQRVALRHHRQRTAASSGTSTTPEPRASADAREGVKANPATRPPGSELADAYASAQPAERRGGGLAARRDAQAEQHGQPPAPRARAGDRSRPTRPTSAAAPAAGATRSSPGNDSTFTGGTLGSLSEDPVTQAQAAAESEQQTKLLEAGQHGLREGDSWWKLSTGTYGKIVALPAFAKNDLAAHDLAELRLRGAELERHEERHHGLRRVPQARTGRSQRGAGASTIVKQLKNPRPTVDDHATP